MTNKYKAFISYRHADNKQQGRTWATWLHQAIETYEVPIDLVGKTNSQGVEISARIYPIFRDEEELPADADLGSTIVKALDVTGLLIVLCSPRAMQSTYVADEIDYFKKSGHSDKIIAVMIDGEPNASWDKSKQTAGFKRDDECFPIPLQFEYDEKGNSTNKHVEPLAADFRINNNGKPEQGWTSIEAYRQHLMSTPNSNNKDVQTKLDSYQKQQHLMLLKIIAGILGVPLGDLTQRDKAYQLERSKQKAKVLKRWLTAVFLLAVIAIGVGIFAYVKQQQAIASEVVAQREKQKVEDMLNGLRENLNFLNIDLHEIVSNYVPTKAKAKLTKHVDKILDKLMSTDANTDKNRYALFLAIMNKIEVLADDTQTDNNTLVKLAEKANGVIKTLADTNPENNKYALDLSNSYLVLGNYQSLRPNLISSSNILSLSGIQSPMDLSMISINKSLEIARHLLHKKPENSNFKHLLSVSLISKGDANVFYGENEVALNSFNTANETIKQIARLEPSNIKYQLDLGRSYVSLGHAHILMGNKQESLIAYQENLKIYQYLSKSDPANINFLYSLASAYDYVSRGYTRINKPIDSSEAFAKSFEINKKLLERDPFNISFQLSLYWDYGSLGRVNRNSGNTKEALEYYLKSYGIIAKIAKQKPNTLPFQEFLSQSFISIGDSYLALDKTDQALNAYEQSLMIIKAVIEVDEKNTNYQQTLGMVYSGLGSIYSETQKYKKAEDAYQLEVNTYKKLYSKSPTNHRFLNKLEVAYYKIAAIQIKLGNYNSAFESHQQYVIIDDEYLNLIPNKDEIINNSADYIHKVFSIYNEKGMEDKAAMFWSNYQEKIKYMQDNNIEYIQLIQ